MQSSNENSFVRVESLRGAADEVGVAEKPRDDLHLLGAGAARGDPVVAGPAARVVVGALGQQGWHCTLSLQDHVQVTLGSAPTHTLHLDVTTYYLLYYTVQTTHLSPFPWPLNTNGPKLTERLHEVILSDVPGHASQEHLVGVHRETVLTVPRCRQLSRPGAGRLVHAGSVAVTLSGAL